MNKFDESKVNRHADGKFADKTYAEADGVDLTSEAPRTVLEVNHYVADGYDFEDLSFYDTEFVDVTDVLRGMSPEDRKSCLADEEGAEHLVMLARQRGLVRYDIGPISVMNLDSVVEDTEDYWAQAPVEVIPQSGDTPRVDKEEKNLSYLTVEERRELIRRLEQGISAQQ